VRRNSLHSKPITAASAAHYASAEKRPTLQAELTGDNCAFRCRLAPPDGSLKADRGVSCPDQSSYSAEAPQKIQRSAFSLLYCILKTLSIIIDKQSCIIYNVN
jgi:hypothetical protein